MLSLDTVWKQCGEDPGFAQFIIPPETNLGEVLPAWVQYKAEATAAAATVVQNDAAKDKADLISDLGTKVPCKAKDKDSQKVRKAKIKDQNQRMAMAKNGDDELIPESSEESPSEEDEAPPS